MANITAAEVKSLRDATGAGMMDVKRALDEADGDLDKATEILRVKGAAKAEKRGAERTASAGLVAASGTASWSSSTARPTSSPRTTSSSQPRSRSRRSAQAKPARPTPVFGWPASTAPRWREAIDVAAVDRREDRARPGRPCSTDPSRRTCTASSKDLPPQVGVLVGTTVRRRGVRAGHAMQIAAMKPQFVSRDEVPADVVENERRIAEATAAKEGKPEQALPKIIEGRVNGFFKENVLLEQPFAKDNKKSVRQVLDEAGVSVRRFARFEVGQ